MILKIDITKKASSVNKIVKEFKVKHIRDLRI